MSLPFAGRGTRSESSVTSPGKRLKKEVRKKMTVTDPTEERGARRPQVVILVI